ncbi:hypothetical protein [Leptotrichia shahii]|jgi:CRISPR-associated protein, PAB1685 family|uniref:hypothetical protein n=1 Tax=Leptotrichia shahii TaxID=157691 RepID=UPI0028D80D16|nr:hypothetical protein [Leptotrichia shahii]
MRFWNTVSKVAAEVASAISEQGFKDMERRGLMSREDLAQYKELNTELKKLKDVRSGYVTRENEKGEKIKKVNSNTELSEEEKQKIIEEAQEEFNQFEYSFFKWGMAQDMVIKQKCLNV